MHQCAQPSKPFHLKVMLFFRKWHPSWPRESGCEVRPGSFTSHQGDGQTRQWGGLSLEAWFPVWKGSVEEVALSSRKNVVKPPTQAPGFQACRVQCL